MLALRKGCGERFEREIPTRRTGVWGTRVTESRQNLVRKLRLAGVFPGGEPEGTDVGGSVGKLANQNGGGLIVEAIIVFVGVRVEAAARIVVGEENRFEPTVGAKAGFEGVVGWIGD